jgi:hypothetical protein
MNPSPAPRPSKKMLSEVFTPRQRGLIFSLATKNDAKIEELLLNVDDLLADMQTLVADVKEIGRWSERQYVRNYVLVLWCLANTVFIFIALCMAAAEVKPPTPT